MRALVPDAKMVSIKERPMIETVLLWCEGNGKSEFVEEVGMRREDVRVGVRVIPKTGECFEIVEVGEANNLLLRRISKPTVA